MLTAASEFLSAKAVGLNKAFVDQTWKFWIWVLLTSLLIVPCTKAILDRKRKNELLWKIPGCNVNYFFLYLAVAKSVVLNNMIKTNICKYRSHLYSNVKFFINIKYLL